MELRLGIVEYEFERRRRKYTVGVFDSAGAPGEGITSWLAEWPPVPCASTRDCRSMGIAPLVRKDFDARPTKRDVVLRMDELAELWRALADPARCKADEVTVAALRLLILTGQRERKVTDAEWTEFDLDAGLWKIPANRTKKGRAHLVHLTPQAVAILAALKVNTGKYHHAFASPLRDRKPIYGRSVNTRC